MKALATEEIGLSVSCLGPLAERLRNKKVFILGGTGFFGVWLLSILIEASRRYSLGLELHILSRQPSRFRGLDILPWNASEIHWHMGGISSFEYPDIHFDYIIHGAAAYDPAPSAADSLAMFNEMTAGTLHLIDYTKKFPPQALLFVSSGAVYGLQPPEMKGLAETFTGAPDLLSPSFAYGEAKRISEFLLRQAAVLHGFELKIARCFSFLGPGMPLDGPYAAGNFIRDALSRQHIRISGDGTTIRSYQHPADLMVWLIHILLRGRTSEPYNVGSDEAVSMKELAEGIANMLEAPIRIEVAMAVVPERRPARYIPDVSKARTEFGFVPGLDLAQSLASTIRWIKS